MTEVTCPACQGRGTITYPALIEGRLYDMPMSCAACGGTGNQHESLLSNDLADNSSEKVTG